MIVLKLRRIGTTTLAAGLAVLALGGRADAQSVMGDTPFQAQTREAVAALRTPLTASMQRAIDLEMRRSDPISMERAQPTASVSERPTRGVRRIILGAAVGAVGGFFGGGFLGAKLEGECNCDDPGFKGFLIGAPVGAVAGGILGGKYLF